MERTDASHRNPRDGRPRRSRVRDARRARAGPRRAARRARRGGREFHRSVSPRGPLSDAAARHAGRGGRRARARGRAGRHAFQAGRSRRVDDRDGQLRDARGGARGQGDRRAGRDRPAHGRRRARAGHDRALSRQRFVSRPRRRRRARSRGGGRRRAAAHAVAQAARRAGDRHCVDRREGGARAQQRRGRRGASWRVRRSGRRSAPADGRPRRACGVRRHRRGDVRREPREPQDARHARDLRRRERPGAARRCDAAAVGRLAHAHAAVSRAFPRERRRIPVARRRGVRRHSRRLAEDPDRRRVSARRRASRARGSRRAPHDRQAAARAVSPHRSPAHSLVHRTGGLIHGKDRRRRAHFARARRDDAAGRAAARKRRPGLHARNRPRPVAARRVRRARLRYGARFRQPLAHDDRSGGHRACAARGPLHVGRDAERDPATAIRSGGRPGARACDRRAGAAACVVDRRGGRPVPAAALRDAQSVDLSRPPGQALAFRLRVPDRDDRGFPADGRNRRAGDRAARAQGAARRVGRPVACVLAARRAARADGGRGVEHRHARRARGGRAADRVARARAARPGDRRDAGIPALRAGGELRPLPDDGGRARRARVRGACTPLQRVRERHRHRARPSVVQSRRRRMGAGRNAQRTAHRNGRGERLSGAMRRAGGRRRSCRRPRGQLFVTPADCAAVRATPAWLDGTPQPRHDAGCNRRPVDSGHRRGHPVRTEPSHAASRPTAPRAARSGPRPRARARRTGRPDTPGPRRETGAREPTPAAAPCETRRCRPSASSTSAAADAGALRADPRRPDNRETH
ncbi:hypothetical protein BURPS1710b_A1685 [Burkholderia pseudomallei 1710b]|uniref:Uncharacterized protein n=1 Tax=Burkholderia pseudomallei (strain 1710b) TaxID=320372 RepID=Q3JHW2_BURP1|nr:hypothetical protein BURPS1710b_A1685 [Burkholderia pseudomallei 1710b]